MLIEHSLLHKTLCVYQTSSYYVYKYLLDSGENFTLMGCALVEEAKYRHECVSEEAMQFLPVRRRAFSKTSTRTIPSVPHHSSHKTEEKKNHCRFGYHQSWVKSGEG